MSSLADRVRGVVGSHNPESPQLIRNPQSEIRNTPPSLECLDGVWQGEAFIVDRRWEPSRSTAARPSACWRTACARGAAEASLFAAGSPRPPFVFFDLETTGLSGGAGTLAFLVGCAWFDADGGFRTRQILLTRHAGERPLLETAANELARAGALVSFNGKSFDAPLLETRYLFHRLAVARRATGRTSMYCTLRGSSGRRRGAALSGPRSRG